MAEYKSFKDKLFYVKNLKTRIDDFSEDRPEVQKVTLELTSNNPDVITYKPKKDKVESRMVKVDGKEMKAESEKPVPMTLSELPDVLFEIQRALKSFEDVEVRATITRGIFRDDDGSTRKAYFINSDNIDTLELVQDLEKEDESIEEKSVSEDDF